MSAAFHWHGGRLAEARAAYGGEDWIDLSTGINPVPWPHAGSVSVDWRSLPDPAMLAALEAAAAAHFGADPAYCCAVPGSEIGLRLVGRMLDLPAQYLVPSYRTHGEIFPAASPVDDLPPPMPFTLLLANPNNPDGRIVPPARLRDWLDASGGGWLVVDEAFADSTPQTSLAPAIRDDNRLIVLRSFGKFFGLAGVRLGFVLGPREIVARIRRTLGDWPLSAAAIAIGAAAYNDRDWIARTRSDLAQRAAQLDALLAGHGLIASGDCPLFRLIRVDDAAALFDRLACRAILTRPFDYDPHWLRLGVPASAVERARLDEALRLG